MASFFQAANRWQRWMFFGLLPVALILAGELSGWPFLRRPLERLLESRLERPVRISPPFAVRFMGGLHLTTAGLWIATPPDFNEPHFLDAQAIDLRLRYRDLWHFRQSNALRIALLDVGYIDTRLMRDEAGNATWQFHPRRADEPTPAVPTIDLLAIRQGYLRFRDPVLETDLAARFDTREGTGSDTPTSHLTGQGTFRKRSFRGELATNGWLPAASGGDQARPVATRAWLTYDGVKADFEGTVTDILGRRGILGRVSVQGPSLAMLGQLFNSPLPTTASFNLDGNIQKEESTWRIDVTKARIGSSHLAAHFVYDPAPRPPRLEGALTGTRLVLADLAPAFGTRSEEGLPLPHRAGHTLPDRSLDLPSIRNLDAHISITLDQVDLGSAFREPIRPFKATLTLDRGQMGLAKVDARTAKGQLSGDISVDARQDIPRWRSDLAWDGIRLEDWLKNPAPGAKDRKKSSTGTSEHYFTGVLQGRAKLAGQGSSTAQLLASLDGEITTFVRRGTLSHLIVEVLGLDVAQGLGLAIGGDETLPVQCAVVDLQAQQGTIRPRVALVDTPVTLILVDGNISLSQERLNLRLTAKPKNISPLTLRSPIRVEGTFSDPRTTPEPGPIAARLIGGVALAFVTPLAAILPFIDPGAGEGSPCAQALAKLKG